MRNGIIIVCANTEFHRTLTRTLKIATGAGVLDFNELSLKDKKRIILIVSSDGNIHEIFYDKIRSTYLNPVVVIGYEKKKTFLEWYPLFNNHPFNHNYIEIPFDLIQFNVSLEEMSPISSQSIRKAICGNDCGYKGYLGKLLSHDLLKDKEKCVQILYMVAAYFNEKIITLEIESTVRKIKSVANWPAVATKIAIQLQAKLKETYDD